MGEVVRLREEALVWREIDGELVAVDVGASTYLGANPSGTILWQLLADGASRQQLADALVEHFGIDDARARADADAFVDSLDSRGLLAS
jgi:hypothetical protein